MDKKQNKIEVYHGYYNHIINIIIKTFFKKTFTKKILSKFETHSTKNLYMNYWHWNKNVLQHSLISPTRTVHADLKRFN